jgi:cysteine desulfurase/selenocysteine lyase
MLVESNSIRNPIGERGRGTRQAAALDVGKLRVDFPSLAQERRPGVPLVYLDSAATSLKPWPVIRAVQGYDAEYPANVHRGLHALSERATDAYESARARVARFIGAAEAAQVVFTRGTTDAINLVAQSWGGAFLKPGDEIVVSVLEHHSNIVPWQMLARRIGVTLKYVDVTDEGCLDLDSFEQQLSERTRLVAMTAMSNVLGTITPLEEVIERAHRRNAVVLVDAAQSMARFRMDVTALDADFVVFSGHKMCGPTGVGVLYGKREHLESMPPVIGGGGMVLRVGQEDAEWNEIPWKFEAGTPPIAQVIGLGAAVDYLGRFDREAVWEHDQELTVRAHRVLTAMAGVHVLGPEPEQKGGVVAFTVEGVHPHDVAQLVDYEGVAIRAGHHCAIPLHDRLDVAASARASFSLYNTGLEIDRLAEAITRAQQVFRRGSRPADRAGPDEAC